MNIPKSQKGCVELILTMNKKIMRLQGEKRRNKVPHGGRSKGYKSKVTQGLIVEFIQDMGPSDDYIPTPSIKDYSLQDFRNRISLTKEEEE